MKIKMTALTVYFALINANAFSADAFKVFSDDMNAIGGITMEALSSANDHAGSKLLSNKTYKAVLGTLESNGLKSKIKDVYFGATISYKSGYHASNVIIVLTGTFDDANIKTAIDGVKTSTISGYTAYSASDFNNFLVVVPIDGFAIIAKSDDMTGALTRYKNGKGQHSIQIPSNIKEDVSGSSFWAVAKLTGSILDQAKEFIPSVAEGCSKIAVSGNITDSKVSATASFYISNVSYTEVIADLNKGIWEAVRAPSVSKDAVKFTGKSSVVTATLAFTKTQITKMREHIEELMADKKNK